MTASGSERDGLRDARVVEISAAIFVGALAGLGSIVALWSFGTLAAPPRQFWDPIIYARQPVAVVLGALAVLWWLVRARREDCEQRRSAVLVAVLAD